MEDCAETLEELFKRSTAIHEIKSKVMLYREFIRLVLPSNEEENETGGSRQQTSDLDRGFTQNSHLKSQKAIKVDTPVVGPKLSCEEDCDFLQEVHKHTIRLWQMLLFWKKRRRLCYKTPFLSLDLNVILRSINKIMSYFDDKLPNNEFVHQKSQPLTRTVINQVKDTSVIVEFAKDLHKDVLQPRHWLKIFSLIKAGHLKTSTTFTIIDLREYNI